MTSNTSILATDGNLLLSPESFRMAESEGALDSKFDSAVLPTGVMPDALSLSTVLSI